VTDEDPNELRPSLSADVLTEDDRPRRAVRDRQQACHPPLSDARRRGRSGGPDRSARHGERPASIPTLLLSQSGQRAGSGVATPGCDEDDVYRVDVSPEDRFHSKGAPPCEPAGGHARCAFGPGSGRDPDVPAWDEPREHPARSADARFPGRKQACTRGPPALVRVVRSGRLVGIGADDRIRANAAVNPRGSCDARHSL
jgi:hypothetical protein